MSRKKRLQFSWSAQNFGPKKLWNYWDMVRCQNCQSNLPVMCNNGGKFWCLFSKVTMFGGFFPLMISFILNFQYLCGKVIKLWFWECTKLPRFSKTSSPKNGKSRFFALKLGIPVFLNIFGTNDVYEKRLRFSWSAQNFSPRTVWYPWGMIRHKQ